MSDCSSSTKPVALLVPALFNLHVYRFLHLKRCYGHFRSLVTRQRTSKILHAGKEIGSTPLVVVI